MKLFSDRFGYKPKPVANPESLSVEQRIRIRNVVSRHLEKNYSEYDSRAHWSNEPTIIYNVMHSIADKVLRIEYNFEYQSVDDNIGLIEEAIIKNKWYTVYDLLETLIILLPEHDKLSVILNEVLREENTGFIWLQMDSRHQ